LTNLGGRGDPSGRSQGKVFEIAGVSSRKGSQKRKDTCKTWGKASTFFEVRRGGGKTFKGKK